MHNDDLITGAMHAIPDRMEWYIHMPTTWINPQAPLEESGKEEYGEKRVESRNQGPGTGQPIRD